MPAHRSVAFLDEARRGRRGAPNQNRKLPDSTPEPPPVYARIQGPGKTNRKQELPNRIQCSLIGPVPLRQIFVVSRAVISPPYSPLTLGEVDRERDPPDLTRWRRRRCRRRRQHGRFKSKRGPQHATRGKQSNQKKTTN